jgi:hypothetical protein
MEEGLLRQGKEWHDHQVDLVKRKGSKDSLRGEERRGEERRGEERK